MADPKTPLEDFDDICNTIFERWDKDMRSGKLLSALAGQVENYDPRVTRIREILARASRDNTSPLIGKVVLGGDKSFTYVRKDILDKGLAAGKGKKR